MTESIEKPPLPIGPQPGVTYPVEVLYCGECSMPIEYCEYYQDSAKCKEWLQKNLPEEFERRLRISEAEGDATANADEEKKRQKRGGKGVPKAKKKVAEKDRRLLLFRASRGKKKFVTVVQGLGTFDIDLKDAAKYFSHKFSCGSSVTGDDEIVIQGDVKDDLWDIVTEKWPDIDEDLIEDLGDHAR